MNIRLSLCAIASGSLAAAGLSQNVPYDSATDLVANGQFGHSLSMVQAFQTNTNAIAIGQPNDLGIAGQTGGGAVWIVDGSSPSSTALAEVYGTATHQHLGFAVCALPDIDNDNDHLSEVLIGAPGSGSGTANGFAQLLLGGATGVVTPQLKLVPPTGFSSTTPAGFGSSIAVIGDVDGGGLADFAIGAPDASVGGLLDNGMVAVFSSEDAATAIANNVVSLAPLYVIEGQRAVSYFGTAITEVDDFDGDGTNDIAIGAPGNSNTATVTIHSGSSGASVPGAILHTLTGELGSQFGYSLATVQDLDSDGLRELAVGAPTDSKTIAQASGNPPVITFASYPSGSAAVFSSQDIINPPATYPFPAIWRQYGMDVYSPDGLWASGDSFGFSLANAGDLDGDGKDDLLVGDPGAPMYHPFQPGGGWPANPAGDNQSPSQARLPGQVRVVSVDRGAVIDELMSPDLSAIAGESEFGFAVAAGLDLNGDGMPDIAVGAPDQTLGYPNGVVHAFSGDLALGKPFTPALPWTPSASLTARGLLETSANVVVMNVSGLAPNTAGAIIYGEGALGNPVPLGGGYRLVGNRDGSWFTLTPFLTDANGDGSYSVDLTVPPSAAGLITPYTKWHFQYAYIDTSLSPADYNFSNGLSVGFY